MLSLSSGFPVINDPLYNHVVFGPSKGKGGLIGKSDDQLIQDLIAIHNAENWLGMDGDAELSMFNGEGNGGGGGSNGGRGKQQLSNGIRDSPPVKQQQQAVEGKEVGSSGSSSSDVGSLGESDDIINGEHLSCS